MNTVNHQEHWENVYETKAEKDFSWFQEYPETSVKFLSLFNIPAHANIIDIGGGDSHFVDALIALGFENIWVLDISAKAIARAKNRLGKIATKVNWVVSDVTAFETPVNFDFWHDRAAFHFLTSEDKIDKYVQLAEQSVNAGGNLILGTFSENGPEKCSGLPIKQYSEKSMSDKFENAFDRIKCIEETHSTPFNTQQNFLFCSFQKK